MTYNVQYNTIAMLSITVTTSDTVRYSHAQL